MTINYPGYSADEIMSLAVDIVEGAEFSTNYVENVLIPAAEDTIATEGDAFIRMYDHGYHLSTAINCARQIASELEEKGYIEP